MASNIDFTFHFFVKLPLELQKMVWEAAAMALPTLSIQRFKAEITMTQRDVYSNSPPRYLLCFTPHTDFISITSGHRGLLRACRESRATALEHIDCLLPIQYLTTDDTGTLVPRHASVPFNSSGHFCVSGLGPAIQEATEGRGARGSRLLHSHSAKYVVDHIQGLEEAASLIKILTIALDPAQNYSDAQKYMLGWDKEAFDIIVSKMHNVERVSLIGEGVLNRRHHLDQEDFRAMHESIAVVPEYEREWDESAVPWYILWQNWKRQQSLFAIMTQCRLIDWSGLNLGTWLA
ncbi:hypothetical protein N8I77_012140 [Diaporthe amygdali]|uniref:2EXR domain-containing protein n=1 Tax=Phomopsis amygdali TaxID=1214568 RepID=A0AAD9VXV6_PHOAM|nr:hypothetical protein N8I77_012140 [Diaporthe amygdali]